MICSAPAQETEPDEKKHKFSFQPEKKLVVGEELTYEVTYSFIKIGQLRFKIRDKKEINGKTYYSTVAYIDSYDGLPFVDLHQTYESRFSSDYYSMFFRGIARDQHPPSYTEYYFNYDSSEIRVKRGRLSPPKIWIDSVTTAEEKYQDGLSLLYFARMNFTRSQSLSVPCFVTEDKVVTELNYYYDEITDISIDAVDYDIECVRLDGRTDFVSIFGLTGYFEGWFTNDEAAIPIVAKMKVIIGNITLELKEWRRQGWVPPKYKG